MRLSQIVCVNLIEDNCAREKAEGDLRPRNPSGEMQPQAEAARASRSWRRQEESWRGCKQDDSCLWPQVCERTVRV